MCPFPSQLFGYWWNRILGWIQCTTWLVQETRYARCPSHRSSNPPLHLLPITSPRVFCFVPRHRPNVPWCSGTCQQVVKIQAESLRFPLCRVETAGTNWSWELETESVEHTSRWDNFLTKVPEWKSRRLLSKRPSPSELPQARMSASPRWHLLRRSLSVIPVAYADLSVSLLFADTCDNFKCQSFTNSMENLSKASGSKVHKYQTFFFYIFTDVAVSVKVFLTVLLPSVLYKLSVLMFKRQGGHIFA